MPDEQGRISEDICTRLYILIFLLCALQWAHAQPPYAIVIKGGHVVDPKNKLDAVMDIAITDGRIVRIDKAIDTKDAIQVVEAGGLYVTPGLIDIHTHVFYGSDPDRSY